MGRIFHKLYKSIHVRGDVDRGVVPGMLEVYCGPMKSGKSREIIYRVDRLQYMTHGEFVFFKPRVDTRSNDIESRFGSLKVPCIVIDEHQPEQILQHIKPGQSLVIIDEAQFFAPLITQVIEHLQRLQKHIIVAGLDLDFRGKPFGAMPHILSLADQVHKLSGVCDMPGCNQPGTRSQRVVNGSPAHYQDPLVLIGDAKEGYEVRCRRCHVVPGKPSFKDN